jgi:hypothetical protein
MTKRNAPGRLTTPKSAESIDRAVVKYRRAIRDLAHYDVDPKSLQSLDRGVHEYDRGLTGLERK